MAELEAEAPLRRGPGNPVPGLDEAAMREMWLAGVSAVEIGRRLGCSKNTVIGRATRKHWTRAPGVGATPPLARKPTATLLERMDRLHAALDAVLAKTVGIGRIPEPPPGIATKRFRRMAG